MIDNFKQINDLLEFIDEDDFYILQVMMRRKEHSDLRQNSFVLLTVYLTEPDQLIKEKDTLIDLAQKKNARIYLNPSVKSFKKCSLQMLKELADRISKDDYHKPWKIFDGVAGASGSRNPIWVVDLDFEPEISEFARNSKVDDVIKEINELRPNHNKIVSVIPTKNGYHVLTTPFDLQSFHIIYPNIDVHKNNPTLVYVP